MAQAPRRPCERPPTRANRAKKRLLARAARPPTIAAQSKFIHGLSELAALVAFEEQRTLDKLEARLALRRLRQALPDLVEEP